MSREELINSLREIVNTGSISSQNSWEEITKEEYFERRDKSCV